MVAEGDFGNAILSGEPIQRTTPQARAQAAHGATLWDDALYSAVSVLLDDAIRDAQTLQVLRQDVRGESWLFLVEIHRNQLEGNGRTAPQGHENVQQGIGVFPAGKAHHDAITGGDHAEV